MLWVANLYGAHTFDHTLLLAPDEKNVATQRTPSPELDYDSAYNESGHEALENLLEQANNTRIFTTDHSESIPACDIERIRDFDVRKAIMNIANHDPSAIIFSNLADVEKNLQIENPDPIALYTFLNWDSENLYTNVLCKDIDKVMTTDQFFRKYCSNDSPQYLFGAMQTTLAQALAACNDNTILICTRSLLDSLRGAYELVMDFKNLKNQHSLYPDKFNELYEKYRNYPLCMEKNNTILWQDAITMFDANWAAAINSLSIYLVLLEPVITANKFKEERNKLTTASLSILSNIFRLYQAYSYLINEHCTDFYDIYISHTNSYFYCIVPKTFPQKEICNMRNLQKMDLNQSFIDTAPKEPIYQTNSNPLRNPATSISAWYQQNFISYKNVEAHILLTGHGSPVHSTYIADLSPDNFMNFMKQCDTLFTIGSFIFSTCYGGGQTLASLFKPDIKSYNYPIVYLGHEFAPTYAHLSGATKENNFMPLKSNGEKVDNALRLLTNSSTPSVKELSKQSIDEAAYILAQQADNQCLILYPHWHQFLPLAQLTTHKTMINNKATKKTVTAQNVERNAVFNAQTKAISISTAYTANSFITMNKSTKIYFVNPTIQTYNICHIEADCSLQEAFHVLTHSENLEPRTILIDNLIVKAPSEEEQTKYEAPTIICNSVIIECNNGRPAYQTQPIIRLSFLYKKTQETNTPYTLYQSAPIKVRKNVSLDLSTLTAQSDAVEYKTSAIEEYTNRYNRLQAPLTAPQHARDTIRRHITKEIEKQKTSDGIEETKQ